MKIVNADGEAYPNGFAPDGFTPEGCTDDPNDNCVTEITLNNLMNKPELGSPEEPLFSRAIDLIVGQQARSFSKSQQIQMEEVPLYNELDAFKPHRQGMYAEPFMIPAVEN